MGTSTSTVCLFSQAKLTTDLSSPCDALELIGAYLGLGKLALCPAFSDGNPSDDHDDVSGNVSGALRTA
jgi:hypothetical protein